jgi:hypothetical protein
VHDGLDYAWCAWLALLREMGALACSSESVLLPLQRTFYTENCVPAAHSFHFFASQDLARQFFTNYQYHHIYTQQITTASTSNSLIIS